MTYYENDIVEILNASEPLLYLNPPARVPILENFIGQRFRVVGGPYADGVYVQLRFKQVGRDGQYPEIHPSQIILYRSSKRLGFRRYPRYRSSFHSLEE